MILEMGSWLWVLLILGFSTRTFTSGNFVSRNLVLERLDSDTEDTERSYLLTQT